MMLAYKAAEESRESEAKVSDDKFVERMVNSSRSRRLEAAKQALKSLQVDVEYALKALEQGNNPNIAFHVAALKAETALSELEAISEIVVFYELPEDAE